MRAKEEPFRPEPSNLTSLSTLQKKQGPRHCAHPTFRKNQQKMGSLPLSTALDMCGPNRLHIPAKTAIILPYLSSDTSNLQEKIEKRFRAEKMNEFRFQF